jgi:hypothetical protein
MHLGYGNLFAFYYAINLARQLSQYLYSLQNWDAPLPTFLQPWISELAFEGTLLSACLQLESLYTLAFVGGINHGGISSTVTFSKIH